MDILVLQTKPDSILVARFRTKGKELAFLGSESHQVTGEEDFGILCKNLAEKEETKEKIILSLHPSFLFCREVELPLNDRKKVRDIIPLEFRGETAVDTEESVFDALPMEGGRFLATWGMRKDIASKIECMTRADLEPQTVSSAPYHWQPLLPENAAEYSALSDGTALSVFHHRELVFFRPLGGEETRQEIEKTLAALEFGKNINVSQLYILGGASREIDVPLLQAELKDITVSHLPITGELAEAFSGNGNSALGLAGLWALAKEALCGTAINFRHGDLAYTADFEKAKKNLRLTAVLASTLVILLLAECGFRYALVKKDMNSLNKSILTIYREVFPNRKKAVDEVAELKAEIKRMGGGVGSGDILKTMKKLSEIKGDGISGFYETEFEGDQVRLKGDAESFQAANDFKTRAGALFATADVGEIKSKPGGGVTFSFHGTLREAGK
jgi:general secretion pathway protein L